jgi:hypothetical protein
MQIIYPTLNMNITRTTGPIIALRKQLRVSAKLKDGKKEGRLGGAVVGFVITAALTN